MRTDLSKATFIIPIRIESDDRMRNVITSLAFLLENFETNIIVKEVDSRSIFQEDVLPILNDICNVPVDLVHIFEKSHEPLFHRQRVLNEMIMEAKTEIVVNYDCDVILPIESYVLAYTGILENIYDVVYPYGSGLYQKKVAATDITVSKFLETGDYEFLNAVSDESTSDFGWAQFFRRQTYIDGGMENENFKAYAPEDKERFYRFKKLGYDVCRLDDYVYHLEHSRTNDSWFSNPLWEENQRLWNWIRTQSAESISNYCKEQDYVKQRLNK